MSDESQAPAAAPEAAAAPESTLLAGVQTQAVADPAPTDPPAEPAPAAPPVAPESYTFTPPEGQAYDPGMLTTFEATARELNLSQEAAQTLLERMAPTITERQAQAQAASFQATVETWADQARKDPEIGGEKIGDTLRLGELAIDKLGTPELSKLLISSGFGNHPEVIRVLAKAGALLKEDSIVTGRETAAPADPAALFYPSMRTGGK